jgi:patatin-like phospholipase/acyl hydrolase
LASVAAPRYEPTVLAEVARRYFGHYMLSDQEVYAGNARPTITTFQLATNTVRLLTQRDDVAFSDALIAAASAPTYFPAHRIGARLYCVAGIVCNHPGLQILLEPGSVGSALLCTSAQGRAIRMKRTSITRASRGGVCRSPAS